MALLNSLFEIPSASDITVKLGNVLISGRSNKRNALYYNMLMSFLNEKQTIILANGSLSNEEHVKLLKFLQPHMTGGRSKYELRIGGPCDSFDILSAFSSVDDKTDFIASLVTMASDIPDTHRNKIKRIFKNAIEALDSKGAKYKIKELLMMDVDAVASELSSSSLPELQKTKEIRFLEDSTTYSCYMDIETCIEIIASSGILDAFSGERKISDVLKNGNVLMLSGMLGDEFAKKELLFNAVFAALTKCLEGIKNKSRVAFLIQEADYIAGDLLANMLAYNKSYQWAAYIFVEDISKYVARNGNRTMEDSKSYIVFNQGSQENAEFWSAFFTNRTILEKSYSYTKKKSWFPLSVLTERGGVVASPPKYNSTTTNVSKVNRPIHRPEEFRDLKANEVFIYLKEPLKRKKTRIEG